MPPRRKRGLETKSAPANIRRNSRMSVTYSITNTYGPAFPNCLNGQALTAQPDPTALTVARTEPETPKNTVVLNTSRSTMATRVAIESKA
jgi:hypothetical protein